MSQDQGKVFHGPYTATFDDGGVGNAVVITASNKDSLELNLITKVATEELVDGGEIYDEMGRQLTVDLKIDEVIAADLDAIKTLFLENDANAHTLVIQFTNMPGATDTLTFTANANPATSRPLFVSIDMAGLKPMIKVKQSAPVGATIANLIAIT